MYLTLIHSVAKLKNAMEYNKEMVDMLCNGVFADKKYSKMFVKIDSCNSELCDATAALVMERIITNLNYCPGASPEARLVFDYLATEAKRLNWRDWVGLYGEYRTPTQCLTSLGKEGLSDFFKPFDDNETA